MKSNAADLFTEARELNVNTLSEFIGKVKSMCVKGEITDVEFVTLAAHANIWAYASEGSLNLTMYEVETVMWELIEHLFPDKKATTAELLKLKNSLFPSRRAPRVRITPEVLQWLQLEAQNLLDNNSDASDSERLYWKSIIKGKLPNGVVVENLLTNEVK